MVGPNAVRSHRVHALPVLASQLRTSLRMLLAVTVMAVVGQIEINRLTAPTRGRQDATRRAASKSGTPSSRRQASAS